MTTSLKQRLHTEFRDLIELVLIPGLACLLPWGVCFKIFQRFARLDWLYKESCDTALVKARHLGWAGQDERHWLWERRLVTLIDHADHYLGLSRSDDWLRRHVAVSGAWPSSQKSMLLFTFHWGAGYWGLRHAAAHGLRPHALVASLESPAYAGRTVLTWYARARNRNVAKTLGAKTIDIATNLRGVLKAIHAEQPLLGVMDVPADTNKNSVSVQLLGRPTRAAKGLLRLAVAQQIPMVYYITGINTKTGARYLNIKNWEPGADVEALAMRVFQELGQLIALSAPAWHFWSITERFFPDSPPT